MSKVCPVCETIYADSNVFCPVDGTTLHVVDVDGGLIGSVIADRYLVTDLLGEGGMGKVYLARHVRLPQQAAIKVLRADMVRDPAAVARFNREASNASRIDDENVARVYDFGEASGGTVYLAMEFVPGRTLKDVISAEGALSLPRSARIVEQIAKGLDAAHRLKIIHRDLKPDNVLVITDADGSHRVKVVDFGIAKAFGADEGHLTKTGFVVGTPEFMSPEQLLGSPLDARSDVYALALVAFQCLTGKLPFTGNSAEQAMTARLTSAPSKLADVVPTTTWPPALQAVFDAALARDVSLRPDSAGAFAKRFAAAVRGDATGSVRASAPSGGATRSTPAALATTPKSRWPLLAAIGVAAAAAVVFYVMRLRSPDVDLPPNNATSTASQSGAATPDTAGVTARTTAQSPATPAQNGATSTPNAAPKGADPGPGLANAAGKASIVNDPSIKSAPAVTEKRDSARVAVPPPVSEATLAARATLDSLSRVLSRRNTDASTARALSAALRELVTRLSDPADKTRAYFRLIDASALSGDISGACAALRSAHASARTPDQQAEAKKYDEQLGCG